MEPTTTDAALAELLARIGAAGGGIELTDGELQHWPPAAVAALKAQRLLVPTHPGETTICPGCERACVMPVQWGARGGSRRSPFVVCDKRDDIHRVALGDGALTRWRSGAATLAEAVGAMLTGDGAAVVLPDAGGWRVGVVAGRRTRSAVHLRCDEGRPVLIVAGHTIELALALTIRGDRLRLDLPRLARCADQPAPGGTSGETPQQRRDRLLARKAELQRRGVTAFLKRLAGEEGVSVSMVKKILGRTDESAAPDGAIGALAAWAKGDSPKARNKR